MTKFRKFYQKETFIVLKIIAKFVGLLQKVTARFNKLAKSMFFFSLKDN